MKTNWDVIIVGAGPAGSAAAITLAQKGVDVLLVDKAKFPRDKVCGDGIVTASLEILSTFGIEQNGFYSIHGVKIISPKKHMLHLQVKSKAPNRDTCIVPRRIFDELLLQKALACGCRFEQITVQDVLFENKRVCGVQGVANGKVIALNSRLLIGADGVNSVVARRLRTDRQYDRHRLVAMRAYIQDFQMIPHTVEIYILNEIMPGYLWIFPMGENRVNIGLGMRLDRYKKASQNLQRILQTFLAQPEIKSRCTKDITLQNLGAWPLYLASQKSMQRSYDGALLIGDAGAWIDPLTGGGICNALITGRIAAEVTCDALTHHNLSRTFLQRYEKDADKKLQAEVRRSYYIQSCLSRFPGMINPLVAWAGKSNMLVSMANKMYHDLQIRKIDAHTQTV
jgi:geranylgeranyl reductase family protein